MRTLPSCASQSMHVFKFMITLVACCIVQWVKPMGKEHSHDVGPNSSHALSSALLFWGCPHRGALHCTFYLDHELFHCACSKKDNNFKNPFGLGQMLIPTHTITPWNTYFIPMNSMLVLITIM